MEAFAEINCANIKDWDSFHDEFQSAMGFFEGYGRNLNAWIDCMGDMYTNGEYESLTKFNLNDGDRFTLVLRNSEMFAKNYPGILQAFSECAASVNTGENKTHFYVEFK